MFYSYIYFNSHMWSMISCLVYHLTSSFTIFLSHYLTSFLAPIQASSISTRVTATPASQLVFLPWNLLTNTHQLVLCTMCLGPWLASSTHLVQVCVWQLEWTCMSPFNLLGPLKKLTSLDSSINWYSTRVTHWSCLFTLPVYFLLGRSVQLYYNQTHRSSVVLGAQIILRYSRTISRL